MAITLSAGYVNTIGATITNTSGKKLNGITLVSVPANFIVTVAVSASGVGITPNYISIKNYAPGEMYGLAMNIFIPGDFKGAPGFISWNVYIFLGADQQGNWMYGQLLANTIQSAVFV